MNLSKYFITLFLSVTITTPLMAQKQINGVIRNHQKQPLESVTIVCKDENGKILSYTRTRKSGEFTIQLKTEHPLYVLEVTSVGFRKEVIKVADIAQNQVIVLKEEALALKTVTVKKRPSLRLSGDTLIYNPADFADKRDRSIEDVLRRMPGIEIDGNGQIKYNGKTISNFYIDGDNLLDGRYNIASQSIPHDAVDKVQIIEKDQPIKMLRKFNMSEDVALNIVIKDSARLKVMGNMSLGAGLPGKYEGNATVMMFKKKLKFINNIKGNNTGIDPGRDLLSHNMSDLLNSMDNPIPSYFLSAGAAGVPMLPEKRTLRNHAGLLNLNNLQKLNEDWQIKINLAGLIDKRFQNYNKISEIYLPGDTIRYMEKQDNILRPQNAFGKIILKGNTDNFYLENTLAFDYSGSGTRSELVSNQHSALQKLNHKTSEFSNELTFRKKLRSDNFILFYSYISKKTQPEKLSILPGINESLFNDGVPFGALIQRIRLPDFFTNNYAAKNFVSGKFVHSYKVGFSFQDQTLSTELMKTNQDKRSELISVQYANQLHWHKRKIFSTATLEYKTTKITSSISIPFSYNSISGTDNSKSVELKKEYFFVEPVVRIRYQTGVENYVSANYGHSQSIGGIGDVYRGIILTDYRSLVTNNGPLSENQRDFAGIAYNFKKSLRMFFFNVSANYSNVKRNILSFYQVNENISERVAMEFPNNIKTLQLGGGASKYLFPLTTTVSGRIDYRTMQYDQYQNGFLLPFKNQTVSFGSKVISKINKQINWNYSINYSTTNNRSIRQDLKTNYRQTEQEIEISILTFKNIYTNISGQYLSTHQKDQPDIQYVFSDARIKYTWAKIKTDFELSFINITNIKTFKTLYLSANSFTTGKYTIPGRSVICKVTFYF